MSYQAKHYNADDVRRLQELVKEGCIVKQEVKDLNEGLNDTIKAIAEEMEIPVSQLKKVINVAFKSNRQDEADKWAEVEDILDTLGIK
jgi:capsular polysaccharide biosynthesis protein